jgi:acetoin utilization protein AcuB
MTARQIVTDLVPVVSPADTVERALQLMYDFHIAHLPVVADGKLAGVVSEEELLNCLNFALLLNDLKMSQNKAFVHQDDHLYEVVKAAVQKKLTIIPVVDADENWVGTITLETLLQHFAESGSLTEAGSIVVLEMQRNDYSLGTIARITEAEGVHILSSYITSKPEENLIELTLKLDSTEIQRVVATYERFGYGVKAAFDESDYLDSLQIRYDTLMSYLAM